MCAVLAAAPGCVRPTYDPVTQTKLPLNRTAASVEAAGLAPSHAIGAVSAVDDGTPSGPHIDLRDALVVGNGENLELWRADGGSHQVISRGAALHPRRISEDAVLALSTNNPAEGAKLIQISLQAGARETVATLPSFACGNASSEDGQGLVLGVQDPSDFIVDTRRKLACLTLMDRNSNMANVLLRVRVELDRGRVQRWLSLGEPECMPPPGVFLGEPADGEWCDYARELGGEPSASSTFPFDLDDESGWVRTRESAQGKTVRLVDFTRERVSPSGRWLVLGGMIEEADYIHRSLVLFDRQTGSLYPVLADAGPWPLPLKAAGKKRVVVVPTEGLADVVGESDVRWLGGSGVGEILVVDQLVIAPLTGRWAFKGELAQ